MRINPLSNSQVLLAYREFNSEGTGWNAPATARQREVDFKEWLTNLKDEANREGYLEGRQVILNRIDDEREFIRAEGALAAINEVCLKLQEMIDQTPIFDKRDSGKQLGLDTALKIASEIAQANLDKLPEDPSKHLAGIEIG